ncbi:MAG: hypothetical protein H0W67_09100, partial [Gemmatimonadales bacterium]|nr:hypothetical protein [Gemmatimonadales bacterium]
MVWEAVASLGVGLLALWLVLQPVVRPATPKPEVVEPIDPEETPKGVALAALKEIEFDRETGKLSDGDYEMLKAKYTESALVALRDEGALVKGDAVEGMIDARLRLLRAGEAEIGGAVCATCGPRPETDALFCSSCSRRLVVA